ncbi:MAG: MATE family efflux transporter [Propionibacteriaceae bacterium]|nr:MATE family efflux transporter [Propionibacteriaceae bacterium]
MIKNLTVGAPARLIVLFTIPLLIGNLFQQLYLFTDAAVVGRLLGVDALASVGATGGLTFLLIGFTWGSSAGLAIPVAKAFGAGDMAQMRRRVVAGAYISIGIAAFITIVGTAFARDLLSLLRTPSELIDESTGFLLVTFGGSAVTVAFNYLSAIIRALGDSRTPLIFLVIACVLNAALSAGFVGVLGLGVPGAALATIVAQCVSVGLCLRLIRTKMPALAIPLRQWRLRADDLGESARMGLTMGFQASIIAVGTLVLQFAVNGLGPAAIAAFTAASRVDQVASAPLNSFGVGLSTFAAQNRGARQWHRIRTGVFQICCLSFALALVLGGVNIVFGTNLVGLFIGQAHADVVAMAHRYLIIQGSTYSLLAVLFALRGTIQGMGWTGVPTLAGVMELTLRSLAGLVLVTHLGFLGACWASPLAWAGSLSTLVPAWIVMRRRLIAAEAASTPAPASQPDRPPASSPQPVPATA